MEDFKKIAALARKLDEQLPSLQNRVDHSAFIDDAVACTRGQAAIDKLMLNTSTLHVIKLMFLFHNYLYHDRYFLEI